MQIPDRHFVLLSFFDFCESVIPHPALRYLKVQRYGVKNWTYIAQKKKQALCNKRNRPCT